MILYLLSLIILACAACFMGVWAVIFSLTPPHKRRNRLANKWGAAASCAACAAGFLGAAFLPWDAQGQIVSMPWGLPSGQLSLRFDALSRIFLLPVFGLGAVCAASGAIALKHERASEHNLAAHWFFYLLLLFGMAAVTCANDAIFFLLSWEIMSLAPFFLIDFNDRESKVRDAAWIYLAAAHLGAVFLIAFFVALWQFSGQTGLDARLISSAVASAPPIVPSVLFLLAVIGFGAKAGLVPMHVWLPDAHPAAPSHVSALLSGAMINIGLYGIIRSATLLAGPAGSLPGVIGSIPPWWGWLLLILGLATAFVGILKAMGQGNLKRLLAYSSVENMGLMLLGCGCGFLGISNGNGWLALLGFGGCLLHMLNHAGFKGLLFLCAGEVLHASGTLRMELLGGLQKKMPAAGYLFALGAASIACLPPFSGFIGEFALFLAMGNGATSFGVGTRLGLLLSCGVLALVSGLALALYVNAYGMTFLGQPRSGFAQNAHAPHMRTLWPLMIPAVACIAGGLASPLFWHIAASCVLTAAPLPTELLKECSTVKSAVAPAFACISLGGVVLAALCTFFWSIRQRLLAGRPVRIGETWGCGYQAGSARIQYTPYSFTQPLAAIFGSIMGLVRRGEAVYGFFPKGGSLGLSAPDRFRAQVFTPLFEGIERICNACKIIQHGKINIYILYIIVIVICLFIWGLNA